MAKLNQMELNSIRECVTNSITLSSKFLAYSSKACDKEIKQMFKNASTDADKLANKLTNML